MLIRLLALFQRQFYLFFFLAGIYEKVLVFCYFFIEASQISDVFQLGHGCVRRYFRQINIKRSQEHSIMRQTQRKREKRTKEKHKSLRG